MKLIDAEALLIKLPEVLPAEAVEEVDVLVEKMRPVRLVSRRKAAEIIGCQPSYISRYEAQGRLQKADEIEGFHPALVKADVEALAREVHKERAKRAEKKKAA